MGLLDAFTGGTLGGVASGVGGLISGIGSLFGAGRPSLEKQLEVSKDMAKYEHDLSMDAWREQVAYNDPVRQAERLEAAGFSKHNLVGNASINGNATGVPAASVDTPDVSKFQRGLNLEGLSTILKSFQVMENANLEIENKKAVNDQIKEQTNLTREDVLMRQLQQQQTSLMMANTRLEMLIKNEQNYRDNTMHKIMVEKEQKNIKALTLGLEKTNEEIANLKLTGDEIRSRTHQIEAITEKYKVDTATARSWYNKYIKHGKPIPVDHGLANSWPQLIYSTFKPTLDTLSNDLNGFILDAYDKWKKSQPKPYNSNKSTHNKAFNYATERSPKFR